jgi:hypothetical protein
LSSGAFDRTLRFRRGASWPESCTPFAVDSTLGRVEAAAGAFVMGAVLLDVFLTILYARIGAYVFSLPLARATWHLFRAISERFGRRRGAVLSFCGPAILVLLVVVWGVSLTCGAALVIEPELGKRFRAVTPEAGEYRDFVTAMYVGGSSLAILGQSEFAPLTAGARLLYLLMSALGASLLSLTLTYLMQVYTALRERTALGMRMHLLTDETGDAAVLVARLGRGGDGAALSDLAADLARVDVSHHFYPVLFFFRFPEASHSVSRLSLLALDAATLIESAIVQGRSSGELESGASYLRRATTALLGTLEETFLPSGSPGPDDALPPETRERWRRRYFAALPRLRRAGIQTPEDEESGAEHYVRLRRSWDGTIAKLASHMGFEAGEIDPAGSGH